MEFVRSVPRPHTRTLDSLALNSSSAAAVASVNRASAEQKFWNSGITNIAQHKLFGKIQHLAFSADSQKLAVSASARIAIYESETGEAIRQIQRAGGQVYGAEFRADGAVIGAGAEDGGVRVFDVQSRTVLREMKKAHSEAVYAVNFCSSPHLLISAGDDSVCRLWDIRSKECAVEFKGHLDKVRTISTIREDFEFISGSYDHSAKVWDSRRNEKCVLTMDHGAQVESVVSIRGGFASAGGTCVNVWDEAGEIKSQTIGHKKHVTCLGVDGTGNRLISGSLDQFVKIYDLEQTEQNLHAEYPSLRIVASVEFAASVMSLAMSKDGRNFAIGMLDGVVDMRRIRDKQKKKAELEGSSASNKRPKSIVERGDGIEEDEDIDADEWKFSDEEETGDQEDDELVQEENKYMGSKLDAFLADQLKTMRSSIGSKLILKAGAYQYFMRGEDEQAEGDSIVAAKLRKSISRWDALLKQFKHKEALDSVLETHHAALIIAVIEKLLRNNSLEMALKNRSESWVSEMVEFCKNNMTKSRYSNTCIKCFEILLDLYEDQIFSESSELQAALKNMKETVKKEVSVHSELFKLKGTLELILSSSAIANS